MKVKATIVWVSAEHAVPIEARLYDRLFTTEDPSEGGDYKTNINPKALEVVRGGFVEPSLAGAAPGTRVQFERTAYFCVDPDSTPELLVVNRTISLRDSWAKQEQKQAEPASQRGHQLERRDAVADRVRGERRGRGADEPPRRAVDVRRRDLPRAERDRRGRARGRSARPVVGRTVGASTGRTAAPRAPRTGGPRRGGRSPSGASSSTPFGLRASQQGDPAVGLGGEQGGEQRDDRAAAQDAVTWAVDGTTSNRRRAAARRRRATTRSRRCPGPEGPRW
jgi:hypothetical protein